MTPEAKIEATMEYEIMRLTAENMVSEYIRKLEQG